MTVTAELLCEIHLGIAAPCLLAVEDSRAGGFAHHGIIKAEGIPFSLFRFDEEVQVRVGLGAGELGKIRQECVIGEEPIILDRGHQGCRVVLIHRHQLSLRQLPAKFGRGHGFQQIDGAVLLDKPQVPQIQLRGTLSQCGLEHRVHIAVIRREGGAVGAFSHQIALAEPHL